MRKNSCNFDFSSAIRDREDDLPLRGIPGNWSRIKGSTTSALDLRYVSTCSWRIPLVLGKDNVLRRQDGGKYNRRMWVRAI